MPCKFFNGSINNYNALLNIIIFRSIHISTKLLVKSTKILVVSTNIVTRTKIKVQKSTKNMVYE